MPSPFRRTGGRREKGGAVRLLSDDFLFFCCSRAARPGAVIRDLTDLSQDPLSYVDRNAADAPLLPAAEQARLNAESDLQHFAPWHRTEPRHTPELASWGFRKYAGNPGYREGRTAASAGLDPEDGGERPSRRLSAGIFPAVTVNRTDFRILPTRESHSSYPMGPGNGHPFDNLQESSAPAGMPVLVTLVSRDRNGFLIETNHLIGWVPATDIAAVDPEFMKDLGERPLRHDRPGQDAGPRMESGSSTGRRWGRSSRRPGRMRSRPGSGRRRAMPGERRFSGRPRWPREAAADKPLPFTPAMSRVSPGNWPANPTAGAGWTENGTAPH